MTTIIALAYNDRILREQNDDSTSIRYFGLRSGGLCGVCRRSRNIRTVILDSGSFLMKKTIIPVILATIAFSTGFAVKVGVSHAALSHNQQSTHPAVAPVLTVTKEPPMETPKQPVIADPDTAPDNVPAPVDQPTEDIPVINEQPAPTPDATVPVAPPVTKDFGNGITSTVEITN